jgi:hypothetical protein
VKRFNYLNEISAFETSKQKSNFENSSKLLFGIYECNSTEQSNAAAKAHTVGRVEQIYTENPSLKWRRLSAVEIQNASYKKQ